MYGENAHHDVTWTANSTGAVSATLRYDPWGTLTASTGSALPDHRFQGSWYDTTTDLAWVVTRWYAPTLGRFVSEDSLLGQLADPPSRHLYAYAEGEPLARWDPNGQATDAYRTYPIANRGRFRGTLILSDFIKAQYNYAPWDDRGFARLHGDNRPFTRYGRPDCSRSRFCITINFSSKTVKVRVHQSCGDWWLPWPLGPFPAGWAGHGCDSQFPVVTAPRSQTTCTIYGCVTGPNNDYNLVKVSESPSGRIRITYDVTQSRLHIIRPDRTVNGYILLLPRTSTTSARIAHGGDGFPSEEMYWYGLNTSSQMVRRTVFTRDEGPFNHMETGLGDWFTERGLPQR